MTFGRAVYVPIVTGLGLGLLGILVSAYFGWRLTSLSGVGIGLLIGIGILPWLWSRMERSE